MYLGLVLVVLAFLFAIAGIFGGGVFTIVLVPLAVIGAVSAVAAIVSARAAGITGTLAEPPHQPPAGPDSGEQAPGEVPVTPDEYVEALQKSQ
jgi:hypothetical protein